MEIALMVKGQSQESQQHTFCQVTPIYEQYYLSFCTDRHTNTGHTWEDISKIICTSPSWLLWR